MVLLGYKPEGCVIEQHDIVFPVGTSIDDPQLHAQIRARKPDIDKIHIDGYRIIRQVGFYKVELWPFHLAPESLKSLFFANLGGYKIGEDDERHKKLLLPLDSIEDVKTEALKDIFAKEMDRIPGAPPHLDDKADVDDMMNVQDHIRDYKIVLTKTDAYFDYKSEWVTTGYKMVQKNPTLFG